MPVQTTKRTTHEHLRPYEFHGIVFNQTSGDEAVGDCPFCGRGGKFFANVNTGMWQCKVCNTGTGKGGGNVYTFIRKLHELSVCPTPNAAELAKSRKLLNPKTVSDWGCVVSALTGEWLVPGYSPDGRMNQLYRYVAAEGKMKLFATPTLPHQLFGAHLYDKNKPDLYLCEGPWDAMALWEVLGCTKKGPAGYALTGNPEVSLLARSNVLAAPGCTVFPEAWSVLAAGKDLSLMYDNDHPKPRPNGGTNEPVGSAAMKRVAAVLSRADLLPASVRYIHWGDAGYDPGLPDGHDVRDSLSQEPAAGKRVAALGTLLGKVRHVPTDWLNGQEPGKPGSVGIMPLPCTSWEVLINAWRKAMKWTEGLDRALSIMLACAASTVMQDDQLWIKVISPPSTGKTSLCEGLAVARKYCRSVENFTGLHSGFQTDSGAEEDHSLLSQLKNMTFVIKEADPILRATNRDKILAQLRGAYDTNSGVAYGNRVKREYLNHRFTVIMCGTESLLELDSSELGARFLDVVIMSKIDRDLEEDINNRVIHRVFRNRGKESNGTPDSQGDPAMLEAKRLTGGYVEHLRANIFKVLDGLAEEGQDAAAAKLNSYAQFVAFMRARPSKKQDEITVREMSARLATQLSKLAVCLAAVMNRPAVDDEVMRRVARTAFDTGRGKSYTLCSYLYKHGIAGCDTRLLSAYTGDGDAKTRDLLRFLRAIDVVELPLIATKAGTAKRWRLTPRIMKLWEDVHG